MFYALCLILLANENNLVTSDLSRLHDVATYISDDGTKMSWVDHILSSVVIDKLITNLSIFNDVIVSDHKPVSFTICSVNTRGKRDSILLNSSTGYRVPLWNNCASTTLACYALHVDEPLQSIAIPYDALFDNSCDKSYLLDIDRFYNEICQCLTKATEDIIPSRTRPVSEFNIPGWNTYVAEKHDAARDAFLV